jgi:2-polyprenyl-6-hydroxyphenyl methylase/3-demethylubiquinone-9 3-methyltransferase
MTLQPVCARRAPCKCCGAEATLCGVVDYHKNCESHRRRVLGLSGVPIYYHRCPVCRFLFTTAFDHFTRHDFLSHVYNDEYLLVDPDYLEARPRANASFLNMLFPHARPERVLDYGGGNGVLAKSLRAAGFPHAETYDPFTPAHADRPSGTFDCIACFEVLEHSTDPARTIAEMNGFLRDPGLIVLSTMLQPADIDQQGLNWWYAGPRNGHVSLYSRESLERLVAPHDFKLGSFNDGFHVLFREAPAFARHFIRV